MLAPRWSHAPLSGAGAARAGGRWNAVGQAALYLSADHATAIAEYQQDLPRPGTLSGFDVDASAVLNLTEIRTVSTLRIDAGLPRLPWKQIRDTQCCRSVTWDFAEAAHSAGVQGILVQSVQGPGVNLVIWAWNEPGGASVASLDPLRVLPANQSSWS